MDSLIPWNFESSVKALSVDDHVNCLADYIDIFLISQ